MPRPSRCFVTELCKRGSDESLQATLRTLWIRGAQNGHEFYADRAWLATDRSARYRRSKKGGIVVSLVLDSSSRNRGSSAPEWPGIASMKHDSDLPPTRSARDTTSTRPCSRFLGADETVYWLCNAARSDSGRGQREITMRRLQNLRRLHCRGPRRGDLNGAS